jgi:GNAT superfamily N-acetyltransferase
MPERSAVALTVEAQARASEIAFLEEGLTAFNAEATGIADGQLVAVFMRDAGGSPTAGAYGWTWAGICHVRYLFVAKAFRGRGTGTRLMNAVEGEALARGCRQIVLETYDFQAPAFYRKFGFEVVAAIPDYPRGHEFLIMRKRLA